jgi:two-component system cell cycle response regulator
LPPQVLLIDDDKALHAQVRCHLEPEGMVVHSAFDGLAGIQLAKDIRPDLILMGVELPEMDGYDTCELLGVQFETAHTPIIFLSANAAPADRVRGLNAGATDFIAKPFWGDELKARIRVSLRSKFRLELESRRAARDGLTGLWNRTHLDERLASEVAAAARYNRALSCVMLDIDHFKSINDSYGHLFGDSILIEIAHLIQRAVRQEDVVFRYGGEEFLVLCPSVAADGAARLAERILQMLSQHKVTGPQEPLSVTCSCGVADQRSGLGIDMIGAADIALYYAKRAGRNRVCSAILNSVNTQPAAAIACVA